MLFRYNFTNLNRKYDNDTYIMKYIGYILINNIEESDIKNDIIGFFYENSKLFYLDELYLCYDLKEITLYSKKKCLFYKLLLLKKLKIFNKLSLISIFDNFLFVSSSSEFFKIPINEIKFDCKSFFLL